jgi:hypothetical protein
MAEVDLAGHVEVVEGLDAHGLLEHARGFELLAGQGLAHGLHGRKTRVDADILDGGVVGQGFVAGAGGEGATAAGRHALDGVAVGELVRVAWPQLLGAERTPSVLHRIPTHEPMIAENWR